MHRESVPEQAPLLGHGVAMPAWLAAAARAARMDAGRLRPETNRLVLGILD
jgi:hypothetical protein